MPLRTALVAVTWVAGWVAEKGGAAKSEAASRKEPTMMRRESRLNECLKIRDGVVMVIARV
jgi:hypothetical protein